MQGDGDQGGLLPEELGRASIVVVDSEQPSITPYRAHAHKRY